MKFSLLIGLVILLIGFSGVHAQKKRTQRSSGSNSGAVIKMPRDRDMVEVSTLMLPDTVTVLHLSTPRYPWGAEWAGGRQSIVEVRLMDSEVFSITAVHGNPALRKSAEHAAARSMFRTSQKEVTIYIQYIFAGRGGL